MPAIPTVELGCAGRPDPQLHVRDVARAIGAAIEQARLVVVQGDTSSALGGALGRLQAEYPGGPCRSGPAQPRSPESVARRGLPDRDRRPCRPAFRADRVERCEPSPRARRRTDRSDRQHRHRRLARAPAGAFTSARKRPDRKRLLVTCHRRESWGEGSSGRRCMREIARRDDVDMTFVLHPNPRVADSMRHLLGGVLNIRLHEPFGHPECFRRCTTATWS